MDDDELSPDALGIVAPSRPRPRMERMLPPDSAATADDGQDDDKPLVKILPGRDFLRSITVPEPIIDGLLHRNRILSLTAPTGHAKTAIATLMQLSIAAGRTFAARDTEPGRVLVLAGENPDDYALRLLATLQSTGIPLAAMDWIHVIPGSFALGPAKDDIEAQVREIGELAAVFVDTSAAYYTGVDENSNTEAKAHASRLRSLCELPGRPGVIALCHPTKNPSKDNLLPRGGGAFLAEVDGNLTAWRDDKIITLHWAGKLRGPGFEPVSFELVPQTLELLDTKGRPVVSVAVRHVPDDVAEQLHAKAVSDDDTLLLVMMRNPDASLRDLAMRCGWTSGTGKPQVSRVKRRMDELAVHGLVMQDRKGAWRLTSKGLKDAEGLL